MDDDSKSNNNTRRSSFQDAQGHGYSQLSSSAPSLHITTTTMTTSSSMSLSMATDQEYGEQGLAAAPIQSETIYISSDDDNSNRNKDTHHQEEMTSILSQEWLPPAASTPLSAITTTNPVRSEREIENDLFNNIEQLVREFSNRPNRQYPYYRIMRWTTGENPRIEHFVTVVINRPMILL